MAAADQVLTATRAPDILIRTAPPLSATSDAPLADVAKPPVSASNNPADRAGGVAAEMSGAEQAAARAAKVTDTTEAAADAESGDTTTPVDPKAAKPAKADDVDISDLGKDLPSYAVREITKARRAAREQVANATATAEAAAKTATEAAETARAQLAELQAAIAATKAAEKPAEPAVDATADAKPTRSQFDDPDAYDEALTGWAKREGVRATEAAAAAAKAEADAALAVQTQAAQQAAQDAQAAQELAQWEVKTAEAVEKFPDFMEVVFSDKVLFTDPMAAAIRAIDRGAEVAYTMAQDPAEVARIAALPPYLQMVELGRVQERLSAPARRAPRPRPLEPIESGNSPADTSEREESMDAVAARVTSRIHAARRPFMEQSPGRH